MKIIDLSIGIDEKYDERTGISETECRELKISSATGRDYTAVVYRYRHGSMSGTYLDFPGHIKETDDGFDAVSYPIEKLYRINTAVIHLNRESGSGAVSAEELRKACKAKGQFGAVIVNALAEKRFDEVEDRSVYLGNDAIEWIIGTGAHLVVSDIYESQQLHGVFYRFFEAGVSTVCWPVNLHKLDVPEVKLTVMCLPVKTATQMPCRIIAEIN